MEIEVVSQSGQVAGGGTLAALPVALLCCLESLFRRMSGGVSGVAVSSTHRRERSSKRLEGTGKEGDPQSRRRRK